MADKGFILYWRSGAIPCWKIMMIMINKGIKYEGRTIDFEKKEEKGPAIMKWNHRGQVPTLIHGDFALCDSSAACDYLHDLFPDRGLPLMPPLSDRKGRAKVLQRKYEVFNFFKTGVQDLLYYLWFQGDMSRPKYAHTDDMESRKQGLCRELDFFEEYVAGEGEGGHLAGPKFTMADVFFFPYLAIMVRNGLELHPRWPALAAYHDMMWEYDHVEKGSPPHWKEFPRKFTIADVHLTAKPE